MNSIYIIILAICNDLSMMPLSTDNQKASLNPEEPNVAKILIQSTIYGVMEAFMSILFFYSGASRSNGFLREVETSTLPDPTDWRTYNFNQHHSGPRAVAYDACILNPPVFPITGRADFCAPSAACLADASCLLQAKKICCADLQGLIAPGVPHYGSVSQVCTEITTLALFLQIFIASEMLIFPMRTIGWMWSIPASKWLYISVFGVCIIFSILAAEGVPWQIWAGAPVFDQHLGWENTGIVWLWSLVGVFLMDILKYIVVWKMDGKSVEIECESIAQMMAEGMKPNHHANEDARKKTVEDARRRSQLPQEDHFKVQDHNAGVSVGQGMEVHNRSWSSAARRVSQAKGYTQS
jgi:hypothetical protein